MLEQLKTAIKQCTESNTALILDKSLQEELKKIPFDQQSIDIETPYETTLSLIRSSQTSWHVLCRDKKNSIVGGFGTVYSSRYKLSLNSHQKWEIKSTDDIVKEIAIPETSSPEMTVKSAITEARRQHEQFLKVLSVTHSNQYAWIIMQNAGITLFTYVNNHSIGFDLKIRIASGILNAYLRTIQYQVLHNDLTPNNICIKEGRDDSVMVTIIDFGLSTEENEQSQPAKSLGTKNYLAPELIQTPSAVSQSSNIYSIGKVLLFLFSKKESKNQVSLIESVLLEKTLLLIKDMTKENPLNRPLLESIIRFFLVLPVIQKKSWDYLSEDWHKLDALKIQANPVVTPTLSRNLYQFSKKTKEDVDKAIQIITADFSLGLEPILCEVKKGGDRNEQLFQLEKLLKTTKEALQKKWDELFLIIQLIRRWERVLNQFAEYRMSHQFNSLALSADETELLTKQFETLLSLPEQENLLSDIETLLLPAGNVFDYIKKHINTLSVLSTPDLSSFWDFLLERYADLGLKTDWMSLFNLKTLDLPTENPSPAFSFLVKEQIDVAIFTADFINSNDEKSSKHYLKHIISIIKKTHFSYLFSSVFFQLKQALDYLNKKLNTSGLNHLILSWDNILKGKSKKTEEKDIFIKPLITHLIDLQNLFIYTFTEKSFSEEKELLGSLKELIYKTEQFTLELNIAQEKWHLILKTIQRIFVSNPSVFMNTLLDCIKLPFLTGLSRSISVSQEWEKIPSNVRYSEESSIFKSLAHLHFSKGAPELEALRYSLSQTERLQLKMQ